MLCRPPFWITFVALGTLGACTQFPELDRTVTPDLEAAEYPALVPVEPLLAKATTGRVDPIQTEAALQGRLSRLRARAAGLRGSVLSGRERQRLREGFR
jgi:hypothetical protein